jgi:hypothetical protein
VIALFAKPMLLGLDKQYELDYDNAFMDAGTSSLLSAFIAASLTRCKAWSFGIPDSSILDFWKNLLAPKALNAYDRTHKVAERCFGVQ